MRKNKKNPEELLQEAMDLIAEGHSIRHAEQKTGISNLKSKLSAQFLADTSTDGKDAEISPKDVKLNPNRDNGVYTKCWEGTYICKPHGEETEAFIKRKRKQYGKRK